MNQERITLPLDSAIPDSQPFSVGRSEALFFPFLPSNQWAVTLKRQSFFSYIYFFSPLIDLNWWGFSSLVLDLYLLLFLSLFLCKLYARRGAWTHNSKIKCRKLYQLSQPVPPLCTFAQQKTNKQKKHIKIGKLLVRVTWNTFGCGNVFCTFFKFSAGTFSLLEFGLSHTRPFF